MRASEKKREKKWEKKWEKKRHPGEEGHPELFGH
jgi:hypothetical protein